MIQPCVFILLVNTVCSQSNSETMEQQAKSDPVHPGDSVTLQCIVLSETCTGEHSVYWFRAGSGDSHPGVIYTHGNRSDECKKSPETPSPTQSCVYSHSKNNLSLSDAGTYYCAVAICGEILVGNGTKLDIENPRRNVLIPVTFILGEALLMCIVLIIYLMYTRKNKKICDCCNAGTIPLQSGSEVPNSSQQSDQGNGEDMLQYSALSFPQNTTPAKAKSDAMGGESVYSDVKSFGCD
ncbi:uncharacterized protein LOC115169260 isoform X1 [Salmo trutta]|uniref:Uncharacterized LOC115169260 n=1 Tax=Salmo trutta TaxID=8032 RepID=A0A673W7L2_SALTR|nr:uncharacterized protein LOC115169260 isoform X1 [Salmo trutta]